MRAWIQELVFYVSTLEIEPPGISIDILTAPGVLFFLTDGNEVTDEWRENVPEQRFVHECGGLMRLMRSSSSLLAA
jgi:hypothetical protein